MAKSIAQLHHAIVIGIRWALARVPDGTEILSSRRDDMRRQRHFVIPIGLREIRNIVVMFPLE